MLSFIVNTTTVICDLWVLLKDEYLYIHMSCWNIGACGLCATVRALACGCVCERERERERVCGALELIWKAVNLIMCHSWGSTKDYSKAEVLSL